jgi:hypothetical protein
MPDEPLKPTLIRNFRMPRGTDAAASDDDALLPGSADAYKAAAFPSKRPLERLCLVMGKEGFRAGSKAYRFFQYVHLDSDLDFGFTEEGQQFTLRFAGQEPKEIVVRGRNLLRICDYIQLHRLAWIRICDRDFSSEDSAPNHEPIITSIEVRDWKPKDE